MSFSPSSHNEALRIMHRLSKFSKQQSPMKLNKTLNSVTVDYQPIIKRSPNKGSNLPIAGSKYTLGISYKNIKVITVPCRT